MERFPDNERVKQDWAYKTTYDLSYPITDLVHE